MHLASTSVCHYVSVSLFSFCHEAARNYSRINVTFGNKHFDNHPSL